MLRSRKQFIIPRNKESGHPDQLRTDVNLQLGPPPDKVDRTAQALFGPAGARGINTFPTTGGLMGIGRVPIVHLVRSPSMVPGNAVDDRATVPAVYAGNPLP